MNQTEQMREALRELTEAICKGRYEDPAHDRIYQAIIDAKQALAAEPAKLVQLTEDEIAEFICMDYRMEDEFNRAFKLCVQIMEAMIKKNGGVDE